MTAPARRESDPAIDELDVISKRIARIPDKYRHFTVPAERAHLYFRISPELLERVLDLGLPHRRDGDELHFDENDLKSVSMAFPGRSPHRGALKGLADALLAGAAEPMVRRTVNLLPHCPVPGHEGTCGFRVAPQASLGSHTVAVRTIEPNNFEVDIAVPGGTVRLLELTAPERQLFDAAAELRYHRIPLEANRDLAFLADTGLADCRLATLFLAHRGRELGVDVREATGLFLSRPFSPRHFWIELRRGDTWLPADPFFLTALGRWELLDAAQWPDHRSPTGAFWTVPMDPDVPLVSHEGGCPMSIMTH
jgi:hypothetical protein